jgi:hypothetical protein
MADATTIRDLTRQAYAKWVPLVQRTLKCAAVEGEKLHQHIESGASFTSQAIPLARPMR